MSKPMFLRPIPHEGYRRYLPSAFDSSMSIYEELTTIHEYLNQVIKNQNELIGYVDENLQQMYKNIEMMMKEIERFEGDIINKVLPENLVKILKEWLEDGTLAEIINKEVFDMKADKTRANFINIQEYRNLTVEKEYKNVKYLDWSDAIDKALKDADDAKVMLILHDKDGINISKPIKPFPHSMIVGYGMFNSEINIKGGFTAFDLTGVDAKEGFTIEGLAVIGDGTENQVGLDTFYFVNGSVLRDFRVEKVDIGIRIQKSWYGRFDNIFIRSCLTYGLKLDSTSSLNQVNATTFNSIFIQDCKVNSAYLNGVNVSAAIKFEGCTFESSGETSVVSKGFSPLTFENCYFERNAQKYASEDNCCALTWQQPIDIKFEGTTVRNVLVVKGSHFARKNDFTESSQKCSIYVGDYAQAEIRDNQFVCNTAAYIDADIWTTDLAKPAIVENNTQDGYAKRMYIGAVKPVRVAVEPDSDFKFVSTFYMSAPVNTLAAYYLVIIPKQTATLSKNAYFKCYNALNSEQIGADLKLPLQIEKDVPIRLRIDVLRPNLVDVIEIKQTIEIEEDNMHFTAMLIYQTPSFT